MSEPNFIQNGYAANDIIGTATFPPVFYDFPCPENLIPANNLWQNGPVIYCETNVVNNFLPPEFYGLNMNFVPGPETNNIIYNEAYLPNHIHGRPLLPNDASNNLPLYRIPGPYGDNTLNNHVKDQTWYNATSDFINNHQTHTDNTKINKIESNKRYDKHANNMEQRLKTYIDDLWVKNVEKMIDEAALEKRKVEEKKKNKCLEDSSSTSMAIRRYNNYQRFLYNYPNKYGDLPKRRHSVETESTTLDANIGKRTKEKISYIDIEKRSKSKHIKETIEKTYDKGRPGKVVKTYKKKIEKLCKSHIKQINETFRIKYSKYETEKGTQNEADSKKKQKTHSKQDIEKGIDTHNEETDKNGCKKNDRNEISSENCNKLNDETKLDNGNDFKKENSKNEYPKKIISIKINKNILDKYDVKKITKSNIEDMKNTNNLNENKSMLKVDIEPENSINNTITQKTDITNTILNIDKYETISIPDDETEEIETKENQSEINNISGLTETKDIHDVRNEIENKPELDNKSNMKLKEKDILSPTKDKATKNNTVDIKQIFPEEKLTNNLLDDGEIERRTSINLKRAKTNTNNTELSPVKSKPKPKKTKRIKLVIQYIESPSDSSDSEQPTRHSPTQDISFLDDFNVDEIVDSLNVNNKHDTTITSKNIDGENISEFHTPGSETISQVNEIGEANLRRGKKDTECEDQITIIEEKDNINQRSTTLENIKPDGKGETCANIYKYILESYKDQRPPMDPPVTVNSKHNFEAKKFMECNNINKNIIDISEEEPRNSDNVNDENTIKSNANNSNSNAQSHTCDIADIYKFLHESYEAHQNKLSLNKNNRDVANGDKYNTNDVIVIEEDKTEKIIEISDDECCSSDNSNQNKIQPSKVSMHCLSNFICAAEEKISISQKPNYGIDCMINSTNESIDSNKPLHSLNLANSYTTEDIVVADILNTVKNKSKDSTTIKILEKNENIETLTQFISEPTKNISVQSQNQFYTTTVNKRKKQHEILDHLENIKTNNAQKSAKGKTIHKVKRGNEKDNTIAKDCKHDNLKKGKHTNSDGTQIHDDKHSRNKKYLSLSSNKRNKSIPKDSLDCDINITNCKSVKLPKNSHALNSIKEDAKKYKNYNIGSESMLVTDRKTKIDSSKAIYDSEVKNTSHNTVDSKINQHKKKTIKPNNRNTSQKRVPSNMVEQINIPEYQNKKAIIKPEKHNINIESTMPSVKMILTINEQISNIGIDHSKTDNSSKNTPLNESTTKYVKLNIENETKTTKKDKNNDHLKCAGGYTNVQNNIQDNICKDNGTVEETVTRTSNANIDTIDIKNEKAPTENNICKDNETVEDIVTRTSNANSDTIDIKNEKAPVEKVIDVSMHCLSNSICAAEEKISISQKPNYGIDCMINSTNESIDSNKPLHSLNLANSYTTEDIVVADILNTVKNKSKDSKTIKILEKNENIETLTQFISEPTKNISVQSQNQFYTTTVNKRKKQHEILDHLENIKTNNAQKSAKGKTIDKVKRGNEKDNTIAKDCKHDNLKKGKHTNSDGTQIHDDKHSRNKKYLSLSSNKRNKSIPKDSLDCDINITNCKSVKLPKNSHALNSIKEDAKKYKNYNIGSESMLVTDRKTKIDSSKAIYDAEVKNTSHNTVDSKINQHKKKTIKPNNRNTSQKRVPSNMVEQINIPEYQNKKAIIKPEKHNINIESTMPSVKMILTINEQISNIGIDHSKTDNSSKNTPLNESTTKYVKLNIENETKTTKKDKNNDHLKCAGGYTNVQNNIQDNICKDNGTVEETVTRTSNANIDTIDIKNEKAPTENNICKDNETVEDIVTRTSNANSDTIDIKNEKAPVEKVIDVTLNVENNKNISYSSKDAEQMPFNINTEDNKRLKEKLDEDTIKVDAPKTTDSINTNKMNTNTVQNAKLFKKHPQICMSRKKAKATPKSSVSTLHKVIKNKCHKGIKSVVKSKKGADVFSPHASTSNDSHENNEFYLEDDYRLTVQDRMHQYLNKRFVIGPLINGGYFSNMYKCQDMHKNNFALKILHERFYDAGLNKDKMLLKLQNTTDRKSSLLKVCHSFNMNGSWCFLMYYYPQNLEMALQHGRCIHIDLVQKLSMQLVDAVRVLTLNGLIHADINPRHILLNGQGDRLKLGGFDKLSYASAIQINPSTSKINYRAPEVVLGFEADFRIDVWATALVMYEMSTGTKLFPATYNSDLLFKQLCTMGSIDYGMLQYCKYRRIYFHESSFIKRRANNKYHLVHEIVRNNILRDSIFASYHTAFGRHRSQWQVTQDLDKLEMFHGLLEKMLVLDPRFRLPITFVAASEFIQYNN